MNATWRTLAALVLTSLASGCGKHCDEVPGNVSSAEQAWIAYSPGQTINFINAQGDVGVLTAGSIESRWHNGGGSKGDCSKAYESLHQPLSGLGLFTGAELAVVHSRETGNAPGYVCGPYMNMAPVNGIMVNGVAYDQVYITADSSIWFSKSAGILRWCDWRKAGTLSVARPG